MLDLFCGRLGWSKAFAARGWECVGVDIQRPPEIPKNCQFIELDVMQLCWNEYPIGHFNIRCEGPSPFWEGGFDFLCASPPCEEFAVWGMKHFYPQPKLPETGILLFEYTRNLFRCSGIPWVIENVRPAQQFVGQAKQLCGSFALWGNGVPPILPQGIRKGATQMRRDGRFRRRGGVDELMYMKKTGPDGRAARLAEIPPELANCVADYAERLLEQTMSKQRVSGRYPVDTISGDAS